MTRVLIVGATSAIGEAAARRFAADGAALVLLARNREKLEAVGADLTARGAREVHTLNFDAEDTVGHGGAWDAAVSALGGLDGVLVAHGNLPDQEACEQDAEATQRELTVNLLSPVAFLTQAAEYFEREGRGCIAAVSSVAGERGRASNYVYGSAKAGLTAFLEGLRGRLAGKGVAVVTIVPGFVDSPMTAHLPKNALFASPETVGKAIYRAMLKRRDVVYTPWFWRWIMLVVRHIPTWVFKRMGL